ncbi:MAG: DUF971 domain-containing protein [Anaerolineales bacterium]|nr:DUF971 domain-containing protein [Anaerolineales bacterium]
MSNNPSEPKPSDIAANREDAQMTIKWNNGEETLFSFDLLRNSCPCAECRGGHANMKSEPDDSMFIIPLMDAKTTQLTGIKQVGGYAISLSWADGHSAGIYTWHYLYSLHQQQEAKRQAND